MLSDILNHFNSLILYTNGEFDSSACCDKFEIEVVESVDKSKDLYNGCDVYFEEAFWLESSS